jgi:two-component system response regulator NreC
MDKTHVLLADDHQLVRQGIRNLLEVEADFEVVGEAGNGGEAIRLCRETAPDVLVVDIMMPGENGLEVIKQVHRSSPGTRIVVLSMHTNEGYVLEALRHGASGYVLKDSSAEELIDAIHTVMQGGRFLSPRFVQDAISAYIEAGDRSSSEGVEVLSVRERQVLQLSAEGYSASEIADHLTLSARTAETYREQVMRKLGLRNRTDLIRYALVHGIIPLGA